MSQMPMIGSRAYGRLIQRVRRMVAVHAGRWVPAGREIVEAEVGRTIGRMYTPELATLVCWVHNLFLPVTNMMLMQQRRLNDLPTPEGDENEED